MITTTCEQSKRLKELGAPQDYSRFYWAKEKGTFIINHYIQSPDIEQYAAYTLSELIEWLGSRTKFTRKGKHITACLVVTGISGQKDWYQAFYYDWLRKVEESEVGSGKTPIEAVYNLATAIKSNHTGGENEEL